MSSSLGIASDIMHLGVQDFMLLPAQSRHMDNQYWGDIRIGGFADRSRSETYNHGTRLANYEVEIWTNSANFDTTAQSSR